MAGGGSVSGGVLLILAGGWIGAQILGGGALKRLGIVTGTPTQTYNVDPDTGVPNQDPSLPMVRDGAGNIY
jgi:hypothetical protein